MAVTLSKVVSLVLAVAYVIAAGVAESLSFAGTVAVGCLMALALIWFPEQIGSWTPWRRYSWYSRISPSPAWMVATMGWVFLVGLPLFVLIMSLRRG